VHPHACPAGFDFGPPPHPRVPGGCALSWSRSNLDPTCVRSARKMDAKTSRHTRWENSSFFLFFDLRPSSCRGSVILEKTDFRGID
jgi:hypothetical protein